MDYDEWKCTDPSDDIEMRQRYRDANDDALELLIYELDDDYDDE